MKKLKKGFTLAELMIVLGVLGVIAAILTPVLFDAVPDENKIKFRKAVYVLQKGLEATLNSPVYESMEDPTAILEDTNAAPRARFCSAFADQLNILSVANCTAGAAAATQTFNMGPGIAAVDIDTYCTTANKPATVAFTTADGVQWWGAVGANVFPTCNTNDTNGLKACYTTLCFDVDGTGSEEPFAVGVRNDGRIVYGKRAEKWLGQDIKEAIDTR